LLAIRVYFQQLCKFLLNKRFQFFKKSMPMKHWKTFCFLFPTIAASEGSR